MRRTSIVLALLLLFLWAGASAASEGGVKKIGLVAHDALKGEMLEWVMENAETLAPHSLVCTGTTGRLIGELFEANFPALSPDIRIMKSGPLGGDMQIGALIADGGLDVLVFFVDPMSMQPHDADIRALLRICNVYNTVLATNRSTADFVVSSPLFGRYDARSRDYGYYTGRETPVEKAQ
ncbi:methylglyoxal synthase [Synergistaceae bacterium OttesenSCG-928-I11]|nr:methylglyoxal synthase [Synergistaceae bacterium OttesenSCG-928-I11]